MVDTEACTDAISDVRPPQAGLLITKSILWELLVARLTTQQLRRGRDTGGADAGVLTARQTVRWIAQQAEVATMLQCAGEMAVQATQAEATVDSGH